MPIVIDGFRRSFDRKGIYIKKKGIKQSMIIKPPLKIDINKSDDELIAEITKSIGQLRA